MYWSWQDLQSPVFLFGYSFHLLSERWFDARWTGPCYHCEEEPERPEREGPPPKNCEIVLREQFPTVVPEPGGLCLTLIGISALAMVNTKRTRAALSPLT